MLVDNANLLKLLAGVFKKTSCFLNISVGFEAAAPNQWLVIPWDMR